MTIATAHQQARQQLCEAGYPSGEAHSAARILLDHLTSTPHAHLTRGDRVLTPSECEQLHAALGELSSGRPLAYVTGTREFFGLTFRCDERALIPRPETEVLVETALKKIGDAKIENPVIADLGTGTGCMAIALARELPDAKVFATDVSSAALELARENASTHSVAKRVKFVLGETGQWAAPLQSHAGAFDLIVTNPPYIAPRIIETLQKQIKKFEPLVALDGGEEGMTCYRQVAAQCGVLLKPNGVLLCEMGDGLADEARSIFEEYQWNVEATIPDYIGIERVLVTTLPNARSQ